jgi:molybdopterin biosynthesis enzyme
MEEGHCIAIMMGPQLPFGADTVIPMEISEKDGDKIKYMEI